jgi:hypothetical protein
MFVIGGRNQSTKILVINGGVGISNLQDASGSVGESGFEEKRKKKLVLVVPSR